VADEPEDAVTDADDVKLLQGYLLDPPAVHERPVVTAEVGELVAARRETLQLGVPARDEQVVENDVVFGGTADPNEHGGLVDRAQPAERASVECGCLLLGRGGTRDRGERRQTRRDRRCSADVDVAVLARPRRRWCHPTVVSRRSAGVRRPLCLTDS